MQFYEYYCSKCQTHLISPIPEKEHVDNCNGVYDGVLLECITPKHNGGDDQ